MLLFSELVAKGGGLRWWGRRRDWELIFKIFGKSPLFFFHRIIFFSFCRDWKFWSLYCFWQVLALKHHTSKLADFPDLQSLATFGFRGEALSSLCALGDLTVDTRTKNESVATQLTFDHSGLLVAESKIARQIGTTVTVKKLFCNLPVRSKEFRRNIRKEYGKLISLLNVSQPSYTYHFFLPFFFLWTVEVLAFYLVLVGLQPLHCPWGIWAFSTLHNPTCMHVVLITKQPHIEEIIFVDGV